MLLNDRIEKWGRFKMKKDDVIIMSCSQCGAMSHCIKNPRLPESYRVKESEYVICKICFGLLKWKEYHVELAVGVILLLLIIVNMNIFGINAITDFWGWLNNLERELKDDLS